MTKKELADRISDIPGIDCVYQDNIDEAVSLLKSFDDLMYAIVQLSDLDSWEYHSEENLKQKLNCINAIASLTQHRE